MMLIIYFSFGVALSCYTVVWIGVEEFLYKENVGFLGEMLSKIFQNPCFCFSYNLAISYPNLVIQIFE